jgi:two-component system OmpR family response regulator
MKVLIIEDDSTLVDYVSQGLRELGHLVDSALDGKEGLFLAMSEQYDALILDRMLPHVDGLAILNTLRASDIHIPTIILSAKDKVEEKVKGLKSGADDYLTKPFAFEELEARLGIIAARKKSADGKVTHLSVRDLELDLLTRQVFRAGKEIQLQPREFRLLEYLVENKGRIVTRTMLLENVWDYHFDPQTNVIDVHISRLRTKIDPPDGQSLIETKRGAGYLILDDQ